MSSTLTINRRARFDYFIQKEVEAGICLEGWELKSLRAGQVALKDSYILLKSQEAWLTGCRITPLLSASSHITPDTTRTRKLLLKKKELSMLKVHTQKQGCTLVALKLYWKNNYVKLTLGVAKGKKNYDKREALKQKDWTIEQQRIARLNR